MNTFHKWNTHHLNMIIKYIICIYQLMDYITTQYYHNGKRLYIIFNFERCRDGVNNTFIVICFDAIAQIHQFFGRKWYIDRSIDGFYEFSLERNHFFAARKSNTYYSRIIISSICQKDISFFVPSHFHSLLFISYWLWLILWSGWIAFVVCVTNEMNENDLIHPYNNPNYNHIIHNT